MNTLHSGISFAASAAIVAVAAAATATPSVAADHAKQVNCYGINTCKGTSDCKTAHNDCKGMNSCKGQGFKTMTLEQCKAAGGSLTEAEHK
jgi:opacity protein-like surface antigen